MELPLEHRCPVIKGQRKACRTQTGQDAHPAQLPVLMALAKGAPGLQATLSKRVPAHLGYASLC